MEKESIVIICPNNDCRQKLRLSIPTNIQIPQELQVTCPKCKSTFTYRTSRVQQGSENAQRRQDVLINAGSTKNEVRIYGVWMPLTLDFEEFRKLLAKKTACVLLINIDDYPHTWQKLFNYISDNFREDVRLIGTVTSPILICPSCKLEYSSSQIINITTKSEFFKGTAPTDRCPVCGSKQILFLLDYIAPEEITHSDIEAIRQHWRYLAQTWWKTESRIEALCDVCGSPLFRDTGYVSSSNRHLYCEDCCKRHLCSDALEHLRKNPYYFGSLVLRKARYFGRSSDM